MSIWSKLSKPHNTRIKKLDNFEPIRLEIYSQPSSVSELTRMRYLQKWEMSANIRVEFWAGPENFEEAHKNAKMAISAAMYAEELAELSKLKIAIFNGDGPAAVSIVESLQKAMTAYLLP